MRVDGSDVLEVERRRELSRGRRRMLSARAAGRSGMQLVVVLGRGRHPLLIARWRVEDIALLSWSDAVGRGEGMDDLTLSVARKSKASSS